MTDEHDSFDELASAHLDGQTTPAEALRLAGDPELAARVDRLAAARKALRAADAPVDPTRRDQAIAVAMDAFDEEAGALAPRLAAASVTALVPTATRWRRPSRRALGLAGIAAAVALLALAVPLIDRLDSGSNEDLATGLGETRDDMALREATGAPGSSAQDAAPPTALSMAPAGATPDLGPFSDLADLADAVRSQLGAARATESSSATASGSGTTDAGPDPCADEQAGGDPVLYTALAELAGQPVVVMVREEPDGGRTMVVLDREDCTTVTAGRL